jgi:hypothetical protein
VTPESVLKTVARELVQTGTYKDEQTALKSLAIELASKKVAAYRRTIKKFQRKYDGKDLAEFTRQIGGQASIQQEDDWLEWKAAVEMLSGWQQTLRELMKSEI